MISLSPSQVASIHESLLAHGDTGHSCLQVIVGGAPSVGLAGSRNGFICLAREGRHLLVLLDGAVLVLGAAAELLIVHGEDLVVTHGHFVAGALLSRLLLGFVLLLQLEVGVAALELGLQLLDLLVDDRLLGLGLSLLIERVRHRGGLGTHVKTLLPGVHVLLLKQIKLLALVPLHFKNKLISKPIVDICTALQHSVVFQKHALDYVHHYLVRALQDLMHAQIPHEPLDRVVLKVAVATVQLEAVVRDVEALVRRELLCHGAVHRVVRHLLGNHARTVSHHHAGGLQVGGHLSELELDVLVG